MKIMRYQYIVDNRAACFSQMVSRVPGLRQEIRRSAPIRSLFCFRLDPNMIREK
jgi:hypothetical protein